jgi:hypothetical protein
MSWYVSIIWLGDDEYFWIIMRDDEVLPFWVCFRPLNEQTSQPTPNTKTAVSKVYTKTAQQTAQKQQQRIFIFRTNIKRRSQTSYIKISRYA